jgi:hypothetical protein
MVTQARSPQHKDWAGSGGVDLGTILKASSRHGAIFENEAIRARISGSSGKLVSPTARLMKIGLPPTVNPEGIVSSSPATVLNWQLFFQSFFGAFGAGWASSALS